MSAVAWLDLHKHGTAVLELNATCDEGCHAVSLRLYSVRAKGRDGVAPERLVYGEARHRSSLGAGRGTDFTLVRLLLDALELFSPSINTVQR